MDRTHGMNNTASNERMFLYQEWKFEFDCYVFFVACFLLGDLSKVRFSVLRIDDYVEDLPENQLTRMWLPL